MLNFDFFNQQAEVRKALSSRLNHSCMETLRYQDRKLQRSHFTEVVWLISLEGKRGDFGQAVPAVSKDLSVQGISLIHTSPITTPLLIVGVPGNHGFNFFQCKVEHCSDLGYGFYQIGLLPVKLLSPSQSEMKAWEARSAAFKREPVAEPVG
jgi:hypothetical protein